MMAASTQNLHSLCRRTGAILPTVFGVPRITSCCLKVATSLKTSDALMMVSYFRSRDSEALPGGASGDQHLERRIEQLQFVHGFLRVGGIDLVFDGDGYPITRTRQTCPWRRFRAPRKTSRRGCSTPCFRTTAQMARDLGINGRSHEVLVGFGFKTESRAKCVLLRLHRRDEGIVKSSGCNFVHSLQAITVPMASAKSSLKSCTTRAADFTPSIKPTP